MKNELINKILTTAATILTAILILSVSSLFTGLVLVKLWGWFIAPLFGLAILKLPAALGLGLTISFITTGMELTMFKKDDGKTNQILRIIKLIVLFFGKPTLVLIMGWIIHFFI